MEVTVSHKQKALEHLRQAEALQERLGRIESMAIATAMGSDPLLAGRLADDPQDLAAKNELSYRVGLKLEKYRNVMADMAGTRDRHLQWAQTYGIMAMLEPDS
jgi:hypothetical protein